MSNWLQLWVQTESRAELQVWLVEDRGVSEAKGELIAFLDDDELAPANWLSGLVAGCMRHPDADVVGGVGPTTSALKLPRPVCARHIGLESTAHGGGVSRRKKWSTSREATC
jgi:hypothetical protein